MGKYKFRVSNMMPNSWFCKLRDMARETRARSIIHHPSKRIRHDPKATIPTTKTSNCSSKQFPQPKQIYSPNRPSYHFPSSNSPAHSKALDIHFPTDPPRKSKKKNNSNPISSVSKFDHADNSSSSDSTDIIFKMKKLPPILTKPTMKESRKDTLLHRIKVRPRSPNEDIKKLQGSRSKKMVNCKSFSESLLVVKKSSDPRKDFRESMIEMIIENDIWDSRDLEELLACYLSLNSVGYHDLIVEVFEKIWIDVREIVVRWV